MIINSVKRLNDGKRIFTTHSVAFFEYVDYKFYLEKNRYQQYPNKVLGMIDFKSLLFPLFVEIPVILQFCL